jgi:hypothetical protein
MYVDCNEHILWVYEDRGSGVCDERKREREHGRQERESTGDKRERGERVCEEEGGRNMSRKSVFVSSGDSTR